MNVEAAVLAVIVGLVRKGRIANLGRIDFRGVYVFAVPLVFAVVAGILTHRTDNQALTLTTTRVINVMQYVVLLAAVGINLHLYGMKILGVGAFLNFLALAVNRGVMPISPSAAKTAGIWALVDPATGTKLIRHAIMSPETRLKPLTDIIPIPIPKLATVLSIGDVLLAVGIFMLIQRYMRAPAPGDQIEKT